MRDFKIISVTGAHSGVGKTGLCALLLRRLDGYGAIKFTRTHLYTSITDDRDIITQGDKDTAIMYRAGAERVVWICSPPESLPQALDLALRKMHGLMGVIVEGNSPSRYLKPDLLIFVMGDDGRIKSSAVDVRDSADVIVLNVKGGSRYPSVESQDKPVFRIDIMEGTGEIDKLLEYIKEYIT